MRFLVLVFLAACASTSSRVKVASICADYARYARGADTSGRAFDREVAPKFPAYYKYKFERWAAEKMDKEKELSSYAEEYTKLAAAYDRHCGEMSATIAAQVARFTELFPDFQEPVSVTVLHSLGEMDGGMRNLDGHNQFLIGIDGIARYHPDGDQTAFFHHELFHLYQEPRAPLDTEDLWAALWVEGLAVHAAHVLNPKATPKDLLLDLPEGTYTACQAKLAELAAAIRPALRSRDEKVYASWFMMRGGNDAIPRRAGYCLGEQVAARISGEIGLKAAARLSGDALVSQIDAALAALSESQAEANRLSAPPGSDTSAKSGHTDPTE